MRPDNCRAAEYQAWFEGECDRITLGSGFTLIGPFLDCLGDDSPPWEMDFAIMYQDGMFIRIAETYDPLPKSVGGGGRIRHLSYHYGRHNGAYKADTTPAFSRQCDLRIDIAPHYGRHIHYNNEDHIVEARIQGLDFDAMDPFKFIRAVEEHRKTSKPLHEILGFEVKART